MNNDDGITVPKYYFNEKMQGDKYGKRSIASDLKLHDFYLARGNKFHDLHEIGRAHV